ncbi:MAG: hypothetical protein LBH18_02725 [Spirochaetaceae bacterium]|jgi:hypothetical protein|nr:hypothetical protein [Spirochaetaceae bacterium]
MLETSGIKAKFTMIFDSQISSMSGIALFIIAGNRLSYAIVAACALIWVSVISAALSIVMRRVKSKTRIRMLGVIVSSFAGSLYLFLLNLMNPLLAMESVLICMLAPVFYMGGKFRACSEDVPEGATVGEFLQNALFESVALGALTLAFSLIREPLGFATLTVPDVRRGIIALFNSKDSYPYSVQLISSSTGALFLLAYIMVILRYIGAGCRRRDGL